MLNKLAYTEQLIAQLPETSRPSLDQAMQTWWFNLRNNGGLRLTEAGYFVFQTLNIERYKFELSNEVTLSGKMLLTLDKKLTCPYFINPGKEKYLMLYGGKEATMLTMYGNVDQFITSLSQH